MTMPPLEIDAEVEARVEEATVNDRIESDRQYRSETDEAAAHELDARVVGGQAEQGRRIMVRP